MQHHISTSEIGPSGESMAKAVSACVHCGFCLPACPTYQILEEEMDSPRGRIFLMKDVLEGNLPIEEAIPYVDRCLGCLACEPACPSGVAYRELITPFRSYIEDHRSRSLVDRLLRQIALQTLPYPRRFRASARVGQWVAKLAPLLPMRLRNMLLMLPAQIPPAQQLPEMTPAIGTRRARVALLSGCAQEVLAPKINVAAIRLLSHSGVDVVVPRGQSCCGALSAHTGAAKQAKVLARRNMATIPKDVDYVITTAAGCGSGIHEYPLWLKGEPEEQSAAEFSHRTKDICEFLDELDSIQLGRLERPLKVAYHDACHLSHGQGVFTQPRNLLRKIGNLDLVEVPGGESCCGSAGTYNIEQPEVATQLGKQKASAILSTGAEAVATGNIGCMIQIGLNLASLGKPLRVRHTVEWLADAIEK